MCFARIVKPGGFKAIANVTADGEKEMSASVGKELLWKPSFGTESVAPALAGASAPRLER